MSGLPWVRLDSQFAMNPKVLMLVEDKAFRAISTYIFGLGYCGSHGTDGFIPRAAAPFLHAQKGDIRRLVEVGLWLEVEGGWDVNGWTDYQPSTEETQARSRKARHAAEQRWKRQRAEVTQITDARSNARSIGPSNAG